MKVKVIGTVTEIEATAAEINASQTLSSRFATLLANAMNPYSAYEEEEEEEEGAEDD